MKKKLNFGSSIDLKPKSYGWVNTDILTLDFLLKMINMKLSKIDKTKYRYRDGRMVDIHDIEYKKCNFIKFPYPFKNNTFDEIYANGILEHFDRKEIRKILKEWYRISKNDCKIIIRVPHWSIPTSLCELDHITAFGVETFDFLKNSKCEAHYAGFYNMFEIEKKYLIWKSEIYSKKWFVKYINKLININPKRAERYLAGLIGGFEEIKYELRVKK